MYLVYIGDLSESIVRKSLRLRELMTAFVLSETFGIWDTIFFWCYLCAIENTGHCFDSGSFVTEEEARYRFEDCISAEETFGSYQ